MPTASAPGDREIREELLAELRGKHSSDEDTVVVEELGVCRGQVRVDVALVNGSLHGYEIKSDRDSLRRLERQVRIYGKVLCRATLVTGERHLAHALRILPGWWGVILAVRSPGLPQGALPSLTLLRPELSNPDRQARALAELLWLDEAHQLLDERQALRGYRSKPRRVVWDRLCEIYDLDELAAAVRDRLKSRAKLEAARLPT